MLLNCKLTFFNKKTALRLRLCFLTLFCSCFISLWQMKYQTHELVMNEPANWTTVKGGSVVLNSADYLKLLNK